MQFFFFLLDPNKQKLKNLNGANIIKDVQRKHSTLYTATQTLIERANENVFTNILNWFK